MPAPCRRGEYPTISTTGDPAVGNSRDSRSHRNPSPRGSRFANERVNSVSLTIISPSSTAIDDSETVIAVAPAVKSVNETIVSVKEIIIAERPIIIPLAVVQVIFPGFRSWGFRDPYI